MSFSIRATEQTNNVPPLSTIVLPNYPHHIIQRGHNRQTVFADKDDYRYYLENLAQWKKTFGCKIYAFCLMTNHVHLVVDPGDDPGNLGKLIKRVAGRQTRYVNRLEGRSGTLWECRYKSSPIDSNRYLPACCRYVEMNPVFAGICSDPAEYPWSSCGSKVGRGKIEWLDLDPFYLGLGDREDIRHQRYCEFLSETITEKERVTILKGVQRGQLTEGASFVDEIEAKLAKRVELRGPGRPKKAGK